MKKTALIAIAILMVFGCKKEKQADQIKQYPIIITLQGDANYNWMIAGKSGSGRVTGTATHTIISQNVTHGDSIFFRAIADSITYNGHKLSGNCNLTFTFDGSQSGSNGYNPGIEKHVY